MNRQDKTDRYIAATKAVAKAIAEAAVAKTVDAADFDLFPHTKAVAHADTHAKAFPYAQALLAGPAVAKAMAWQASRRAGRAGRPLSRENGLWR